MNNTMFIARSLTFYPGYFEDNFTELSDEIILPSYHLNKIMESFEDDEMLYINMIKILYSHLSGYLTLLVVLVAVIQLF